MKSVFINPKTQIIRAGWRIVIFVTAFLLINLALMFLVRTVLGQLQAKSTLWFLILGITATLAVYLTMRFVNKQPMSSLGLQPKWAIKDLLAGIMISALIMSGTYFTLLCFGHIKFEGYSWWHEDSKVVDSFKLTGLWTALAVLVQFVIVAWWEELAFRGVVLQNIAQGLNLNWGIVLSTVIFGAVHAANPNASVLGTFLIMLITLKLVFAYLKTGQLWLPIGLHLGWNFFQASIYGFASSGHVSPSLIVQSPISVDWLSGGEFGAENSLFIIPFTVASFYAMHLWVRYSRKLSDFALMKFLVKKGDF